MEEAEWLVSTDPRRMLAYLFPVRDEDVGLAKEFRPSDRKMRLFACACCRQVWHLLTDDVLCPIYLRDREAGFGHGAECRLCDGSMRMNRIRWAVEVAERYADGEATSDEVITARAGAERAFYRAGQPFEVELATRSLGPASGPTDNSGLARWFSVSTRHAAAQAALLRDLLGNPWPPVVRKPDSASYYDGPVLRAAHVTHTVLSIARAAYEQRLPDGFLDPDCLLVLSDSLEEAGCEGERCDSCHGSGTHTVHVRNAALSAANGYGPATTYSEWRGCQHCGGDYNRKGTGRLDNPLLAHLRSPGPHARGCWPVDLVLGLG